MQYPVTLLLSLDRQTKGILELATDLQTLNIHMCGSIGLDEQPVVSLHSLRHLTARSLLVSSRLA